MSDSRRPSPQPRRFVRFCIVGATGILSNLLTFRAVQALLATVVAGQTLRFELSHVAGIVVSILTNFLLNDRWTWSRREAARRFTFRQRLVAYYAVSALGAVVQLGVAFGVRHLAPVADELAVLVGIAAGTVVNFVANDRFTFMRRVD